MRYAIIKNGKVANMVVAAPEYAAEQGWVEAPNEVDIGWDYSQGQFVNNFQVDTEQLAVEARIERNRRIAETDWMVVKHLELNENVPGKWEVYRQALRDVPQQPGFPNEITWPTKPE